MSRTYLFQVIPAYRDSRSRPPQPRLVRQLPGCSTFQNLPPTRNCSKLSINIPMRLIGTTPKFAERCSLGLDYLSLLP